MLQNNVKYFLTFLLTFESFETFQLSFVDMIFIIHFDKELRKLWFCHKKNFKYIFINEHDKVATL